MQSTRHGGIVRTLVTVALAAGAMAAAAWPTVAQEEPLNPPAPPEFTDVEVCRTDQVLPGQTRLRPRAVPAIAQGLSFLQDPPVLSPDYVGTITLRDFAVLGDVPSVRFRLGSGLSGIETWDRTGTKVLGGRTISLFNPSWSWRALDLELRNRRWGWDQSAIYWGEFLGPDKEPGTGENVWLRIASTNLPRAAVTRLSDTVQYSSHVVNLVIPDFGDGYLNDDHEFDFRRVGRAFFEHFEDTYDSLAVLPQLTYLPSYGAFHHNVKNTVRGLGLGLFDSSLDYGSQSRRLRSVELFATSRWGRPESSSHEITHQWGDYVDWGRLTGITRSGHQPTAHDPLWASGETLIGSILTSFRRVAATDAGWVVERTPFPARFHPFTLYSMGLLGKDDVPEITLFDDQPQFGPGGPYTPAVGTVVTGPTRTATVFNVIGMLGERVGPVDTEWNRATIVVSRGALVSSREMDYWTYFSQRLEDPNRTGTPSYDGANSFDASTYGRMDLRTGVRPLAAPPLAPRAGPDNPSFGRRDFREVVFDEEVPSHIRAGDPIRLSGMVNARDRADVDRILLRLWKNDGIAANAISRTEVVSDRSSFQFDIPTRADQRGVYLMEIFLYWTGSGTQSSRMTVSPIILE